MIYIPIILFPICLVLSFFARKSKRAFVSVLTGCSLAFLLTLYMLVDRVFALREGYFVYTYSALLRSLGAVLFACYEFLWLFLPIKLRDKLIPIFVFLMATVVPVATNAPAIVLQINFGLGVVYFICTYLTYVCVKSKKNPQKKKSHKS